MAACIMRKRPCNMNMSCCGGKSDYLHLRCLSSAYQWILKLPWSIVMLCLSGSPLQEKKSLFVWSGCTLKCMWYMIHWRMTFVTTAKKLWFSWWWHVSFDTAVSTHLATKGKQVVWVIQSPCYAHMSTSFLFSRTACVSLRGKRVLLQRYPLS
jgi:hypothetical protein